jgi:hypothetical protein
MGAWLRRNAALESAMTPFGMSLRAFYAVTFVVGLVGGAGAAILAL